MLLGSVEAGGTKIVCGIGNEQGEIIERHQFPTTLADETIKQVIDFFKGKPLDAIGIGSFGPIDLDPHSTTYGFVTSTPKPGWRDTDFLGLMKAEFNLPIGWDTDVNTAAMGEAKWGAAQGLDSCVYFTVGTGIGAGIYAEGSLVHGLVHPEVGHIPVRPYPDDFEGSCPYHKYCLEGMASGPSIEKRWGVKGTELDEAHIAWKMEAYYLAQAAVHAILWMSPKQIIFGGGVMKQKQLFPLIHQEVSRLLNDYVQHPMILDHLDEYIVPPKLGDDAGLKGGLALALNALKGVGS